MDNLHRSPTGCRIGESHHRTHYSNALVNEARRLRDRGLSYRQIGDQLQVPWRTICDWVNFITRYAE